MSSVDNKTNKKPTNHHKKSSAAPSKVPFYKKKKFLWPAGVAVLLVATVLLAFRLSPWPGALVIRAVFDDNGAKVQKAMAKHAPSKPITVLTNQQYRAGDKDALLDVYFPADIEKTEKTLPVIIWTHGGAWLSGSKDDSAPYFKLLAAKGFTVIAPNYTLAPGRHYPYQVRQLNDAHKYIVQQAGRFHADTDKLFFAGDSAGSQLSAQLAALITNPSYAKEVGITPSLKPKQLRGVILNCGIYKMEGLAHPVPQVSRLLGWGDDVTVWAFSGTHDFSDPVIRQMSPYYHANKDFPPTYITGGNADSLTKAQSIPFMNKLREMGVSVEMLFFPDDYKPELPHEYQFNLDTEAGKMTFIKTVSFVKKLAEE